jgi:hypothetical protein
MVATSSNRGFQVPTVGGDAGVWGTELNTTITGLDTVLGATLLLPSSTYGVSATVSSSQAQVARIQIQGAPTSSFQLNLPASNYCIGTYVIFNNSSNGQNVIVTCGSSFAGATVTIASSVQRTVFVDGLNAIFEDNESVGSPTAVEIIVDGGGSIISSGQKGQIYIPYGIKITSWSVMADQSGSITYDVWRNNAAVPTSSLSIVGAGNMPYLTSQQFNSSSPVGWTSTTLNSGDYIAINATVASSLVTRTLISLIGQRTA